MNKFVIVDGLPYLYFNGKAYAVRWDEKGFTVGAEVELVSVPSVTYSELSIKAKCAGHLDSIGEQVPEAPENGIEEMTLPELKEYAKARNIDLNGARTKDAIIEAIKAAEVAE